MMPLEQDFENQIKYNTNGNGYECIMLQELTDSSVTIKPKTRKSIAYPIWDVHELYPYVEEVLMKEDTSSHE